MGKNYEMIGKASELWEFLQIEGGLDIGRYDKDIIDDLREKLSLPTRRSFKNDLIENKATAEDLIVAFFRVVQPYGKMMSEILGMFEEAGAKKSKQSLKIDFDFGKNLPSLDFDLSHFKDWIEIWNRVASSYTANLWNTELLWKLNAVFRTNRFKEGSRRSSSQKLEEWLSEYENKKMWPDFLLSAPTCDVPELDKKVSRAWKVWEKIVKESSKYGKNRSILKEIAFKPRQERVYDEEENYYRKNDRPFEHPDQMKYRERMDDFDHKEDHKKKDWPPELLGQLDSDYWAGSFARGAYAKTEEISILPEDDRKYLVAQLCEQLNRIFDSLPKIDFEGESLIRDIKEFLNLPIWKKRHELYSVWISTQIINVFKDSPLRIHCVDETLNFSFSGTHFATIDSFLPRLHVWAELRSPLSTPLGSSRKKAIQPDYSLLTDPVTNPKSSIIEVECKQYLKASRVKFAHALTDYARGRINAHVILVNYGKAPEDILDDVAPDVRNRTVIIGEMKPDSKYAQEIFKETIQSATIRKFGYFTEKPLEGILSKKSPGIITLKWPETPSDLDLHLKIFSSQNSVEVSYSNKGSLQADPWVQLDADMRSGFGPENIEISRWIGDRYHCAVYNYSKSPLLAGCNALLEFKCGRDVFEFKCPDEGDGLWWDVFVIDAKSGVIKVINKIIESSPW